MGNPSPYWLIVTVGTLGSIWCICWKSSMTFPSSNVLAKASIKVDLTMPSSPVINHRSYVNASSRSSGHRAKRRHQEPISRFMMQLYNRRPDADVVRAVDPFRVTPATLESSTVVEFRIPRTGTNENLETAELLSSVGTIVKVTTTERRLLSDLRKSRVQDGWRAFDVTSAVLERNGDVVGLLIKTRSSLMRNERSPILILHYGKPKHRKRRSTDDDREDGATAAWIDEGGRRRRRNLCRRRPLYVDFAAIAYNEWVVAPPGYEAYQCVGKCFYPFGEHLSPTKHAIVQTLVHGAQQAVDGKTVGRACCVPTRLAPTSLLYIDGTGTLTYQYGYEDMVVAECGCR